MFFNLQSVVLLDWLHITVAHIDPTLSACSANANLVDDGDVSLVLEQRLDEVVVAVDGGDHQRRLAVLVLLVDAGAVA